MNYKVLITASGLGQRLGELTQYTNKSLVRVGKKPALSYVIESYPDHVPLVITLGHFRDHVRDFVRLAHPTRKVSFVDVDKFEGRGTSLGYSMLKAEKHLQCPFIFHACDTLVEGTIPSPAKNWIGAYKGNDASQYASWKMQSGNILSFNKKGAIDFDFIHIGLVGIRDHRDFWKMLEKLHRADPNDASLNDCAVIVKMLDRGSKFSPVHFPIWHDIGNATALADARSAVSDKMHNLDKVDESIFMFKDFVVKFFYDKKIVEARAARAKILSPLTPAIQAVKPNFYKYAYVRGELYSEVATPEDFSKFLDWAKQKLWLPKKEVSDVTFKEVCRDFYESKTRIRIDRFLSAHNLTDKPHVIQGQKVPMVKDMLGRIDFDWLTSGTQTGFHGDFILDNILKTKSGYSLLDWRQDFGGLKEGGDVYYDLAKLNHNLTVNHDIVYRDLFTVSVDGDRVSCDILRKDNLVKCQKVLFDFIEKEGYDADKVDMLTAIIWLNMAPLHHHPFDLFLYYFGKLHLWRALRKAA